MARFRLADIQAAAQRLDPVFLNSPQFVCEPLSDVCGAEVVVKVETNNPIRSFKGRGADVLVQRFSEPLVCASAGNFGQAVAYAGREYGIPITVFASRHANPLKVTRMKALGAEVIAAGADFDAAKAAAHSFAHAQNIRFVEDGRDVETAIGAGTIALELLTGPPNVDAILVPVGNGALINGISTVYKTVQPTTKVFGVQALGAPAMVESWRQNRMIRHTAVNTIADGIAVREPVPEALEDMRGNLDDAILVSEEAILRAMRLLFTAAGLVVEPAGAVGVAALLEKPKMFQHKRVATILCGSNLTEAQMHQWLLGDTPVFKAPRPA